MFVTIRWVTQSCLYVLVPLEYDHVPAITLVRVGYTFAFYSSVCSSLIHVLVQYVDITMHGCVSTYFVQIGHDSWELITIHSFKYRGNVQYA